MKAAIIGFGERGSLYADIIKRFNGELTAVCDKDPLRLDKALKEYNISSNLLFSNEADFFAKGKVADICIVSTQDSQHKEHSLKAISAGYDILLEKPIANNWQDCKDIYGAAKINNKKVFICHVLRYAPFFKGIKQELDSGNYGNISTVNLTENVGYWHQAHSFVRGNWNNDKTSSPMIVAKCCHDLDLLVYYINKKCLALSSMGTLNYFKKENAPEGSSDRCYDCKYNNTCPYSAVTYYVKERAEKGNFDWPVSVLSTEKNTGSIINALKNGKYGKCVYKCDNNVVDHQIVNMQFEGGVTAHLTMTAFSKYCYRNIHIHCEKGEIYGNTLENKLCCNIFGGLEKTVDFNIEDTSYGHGGGDILMIKDIAEFYNNNKGQNLTSINNSLQSHYIGFKAEESRLRSGELLKFNYDELP